MERAIEYVRDRFLLGHSFANLDDLNTIELAIRKLKSVLRRREEQPVNWLWATLGESLDWFTLDKCGFAILCINNMCTI